MNGEIKEGRNEEVNAYVSYKAAVRRGCNPSM